MTKAQRRFRDWITGTLVYAVVMGLFNDYTDYLVVESFSIVVLAALVMQGLTMAIFGLKGRVSAWFRARPNSAKLGLILSIWAIGFFSKFVFLDVIDIVFGDTVEVSGFVGLALIVVSMVAITQAIDWIDARLARGAGEDETNVSSAFEAGGE